MGKSNKKFRFTIQQKPIKKLLNLMILIFLIQQGNRLYY